jgi:hypothetical protein
MIFSSFNPGLSLITSHSLVALSPDPLCLGSFDEFVLKIGVGD